MQDKVTLGVCGNGIVEAGEECDCGTPEECAQNPCCDAECRLRPRAQCSDNNHGCCRGCQIVPADIGMTCRFAKGPCDLPETCDGISADCPTDQHLPDGTECIGLASSTKCASGHCTNRDLQCRDLARRFEATAHCVAFGLDSDERECRMQCMTPKTGCMPMADLYLDGTECSRGRCYGGKCVNCTF